MMKWLRNKLDDIGFSDLCLILGLGCVTFVFAMMDPVASTIPTPRAILTAQQDYELCNRLLRDNFVSVGECSWETGGIRYCTCSYVTDQGYLGTSRITENRNPRY